MKLSPIELLKKELADFEKALEKSIQSYNKGDIDCATHLIHKMNLRKSIKQYTEAIKILET